jgi:Na+/H+ antiporter NhaD/arsenite permease-like protein
MFDETRDLFGLSFWLHQNQKIVVLMKAVEQDIVSYLVLFITLYSVLFGFRSAIVVTLLAQIHPDVLSGQTFRNANYTG